MAIKDIYEAVLTYQVDKVKELVQAELDAGTNIQAILDDGLIGAMDEVGEKFSEGDLYVPEMLMSAKAMKGGLEVLKPHLSGETIPSRGTVVIGTVKGDLHDIGKNLVAMMMEGAGLTVVDLGVDVAAEKFVQAIKDNNANVVALSALLTTTMPAMETTLKAVKEAGLSVKSIIGGAPVTEKFANQIGSDGHSDDAPGAVELIRRLIKA
jgi:5-methyltetrahydrofolate--homocysteine methyltransferase